LAALPEAQREVLLMRFVDGMSLQEIAAALSIPEGTVKSRMHNALSALKSDPCVRSYFE
jgi:RNA polymerase sigma-70 factor (ECF subfamily)